MLFRSPPANAILGTALYTDTPYHQHDVDEDELDIYPSDLNQEKEFPAHGSTDFTHESGIDVHNQSVYHQESEVAVHTSDFHRDYGAALGSYSLDDHHEVPLSDDGTVYLSEGLLFSYT